MGLGERAFKKALNTRTHRERSQPAGRAKLGILEKHKDYVLRARDYHRKQDTLKALRVRASHRNPDEFHFGMIKSRVVKGRHRQDATEKAKSVPAEMLKLMNTQDVGYIVLQKNANKKKLAAIQQEVAVAEAIKQGPSTRQHIFFAEDRTERTELLHKIASTPAPTPKEEPERDMLDELDATPAEKTLRRKRQVLLARQSRVEQLEKLEHKMRLDCMMLAKGKKTKIGTDEYGFAKFKWAVERKK